MSDINNNKSYDIIEYNTEDILKEYNQKKETKKKKKKDNNTLVNNNISDKLNELNTKIKKLEELESQRKNRLEEKKKMKEERLKIKLKDQEEKRKLKDIENENKIKTLIEEATNNLISKKINNIDIIKEDINRFHINKHSHLRRLNLNF